MAQKYLAITEVSRLCRVDVEFIQRLEQEELIVSIVRRRKKFYTLDQVDRVRVARLLIEDMGVNLEGAEVVLNMREQMLSMRRQFSELLKLVDRKTR